MFALRRSILVVSRGFLCHVFLRNFRGCTQFLKEFEDQSLLRAFRIAATAPRLHGNEYGPNESRGESHF